ncbi:MAG TPA: ATP-dependent Clp protease proteolytic subunit, partial [Thermomicrobiaceae bacterium]|nr:ATP-dependent Clp protease proteolytic subunit [Thermomicrobiaceae bacterium]
MSTSRDGAFRRSRRPSNRRSWLAASAPAIVLALMLDLALLVTLGAIAPASAAGPRVYGLKLNGVISQVSADRVVKVLDEAEQAHVDAVLIEINSPGGVEASTRRITQAILAARVPVIVFVGPDQDSQALSGAFPILLAANVAAALPAAKIGAQPQQGLGDVADQQDKQDRIARALQLAIPTAQTRQRNAAEVSSIVQNETSVSGTRALQLGIINLTASSDDDVLSAVDGRTVHLSLEDVTLHTADSSINWLRPNWHQRLFHAITNPNVAYLLFSAGVLLVIIALYAPGRLLAGVPGVLALIVAMIAFGNLPVSWLAVGLLILGAILLIAEFYTRRVGIAGVLGVIAYMVGSFTLYQPIRQASPTAPAVHVYPWLIVGTVSFLVITLLLVLRAMFRARQELVEQAARALIGKRGIVTRALEPDGEVRV